MLLFGVSMEIIAVMFFLFLHNWSLWNRKRIRGFKFYQSRQNISTVSKNYPLFVKFQIEKTVQMTSLFLPIVLVKCFMQLLSNASAFTANTIGPNNTPDVQMIIYELVNVSYLQSFTTSILLLVGSGQLRRAFGCSAKKLNKVASKLKEIGDQDEHFDRLKVMFEK
uniref:Uncharacterized protein n=1 Tax=Ditylenchus dipsaci TaxID=166011 RepID=A0A915E610_9BILA